MHFNSAHVISISAYSALFLVSSVANLTVLYILIRRYRKIKSRVNLLLINLAIADLLVSLMAFFISTATLLEVDTDKNKCAVP